MYLYLYLWARAIVSVVRVLLSANRGRSAVVTLASVIAGAREPAVRADTSHDGPAEVMHIGRPGNPRE